jgi:tRNA uracil 4-sulfurtransferase
MRCALGSCSVARPQNSQPSVAQSATAVIESAARSAGAEPCALLKFGELALKGRNRDRFTAQLERNLRQLTSGIGRLDVRYRGLSFLAFAPPGRLEAMIDAALRVPGLSVVQPALRAESTPDAATRLAIELLRGSDGSSFAVRARRREEGAPLSSGEAARVVGAGVQSALGLDVDLDDPDVEVHIELGAQETFASVDRLRGVGGLPVGTSGAALVLLSGGIDSPVAAYRMMKRGLRCAFVHFSGQPLTGPESAYKAYALAARLSRFQSASKLFVIPFGLAQRSLANSGAGRFQVLAQRRLMVRVADALAEREGHDALVTGDSLGQVASQTIRNLDVVERAASLPLLRPLLDRDKDEIVGEARALGTYDVSVLPDEDCCTLLAHPRAVTWAREDPLLEIERRADVSALTDELIGKARVLVPRVEDRPSADSDGHASATREGGRPTGGSATRTAAATSARSSFGAPPPRRRPASARPPRATSCP